MELKHLTDDHDHASVSPTRRRFLASMLAASIVAPWALGQSQDRNSLAENFRRESEEAEREGLAQPFKGITTDGIILPNLFEIAPTVWRQTVCAMRPFTSYRL